jgi:hypothetical protein
MAEPSDSHEREPRFVDIPIYIVSYIYIFFPAVRGAGASLIEISRATFAEDLPWRRSMKRN